MTRSLPILAAFVLLVLTSCKGNAGQPEAEAKQMGPGDHLLTLKVGELERRYLVRVPPQYDGKTLDTGSPMTPSNVSEADGVRIEACGPGRDGAEVIYVTVQGPGHTWPGGKSLLPESMVGKRSDKLKATDAIWEFFDRLTPQERR